MASSSEAPKAGESSPSSFTQRLERHERVPRMDLPEGLARPAAPSYARFIPREEVGPAMAWVPDRLDVRAGSAAGKPPGEAAPVDPAATQAARQTQLQARLAAVFEQGRQMGSEEAQQQAQTALCAALEQQHRQHVSEIGTPVTALLTQFQLGLDGLGQDVARRLAGIAMQMARQVVRSELSTRAALVVDVTQEALSEVLLSARHITVKVHPKDFALVEAGCTEAFKARGARLLADAHVGRGGCLVESDLGVVDARLQTRWAAAVAAMGAPVLADVDASAASVLDAPTDLEMPAEAETEDVQAATTKPAAVRPSTPDTGTA